MRSLLKRPSTQNQHIPWSKQNQYVKWYTRNYEFAKYIEQPLKDIFYDDLQKAKLVYQEATTIYNTLSSFYHNHYPDRRFFNTNYLYHQILKMLQSHGTISSLDAYNIIYGTPGMKARQDNRTLKKWASEYEEFVLQNIQKLSDEHPHILTSYFIIAPPGLNLIKKTD